MSNEAFIAAREGKLEKLKQLLNEGADIHARDDNGLTLLHHAAGHGHHKVVKCLLKKRADVLLTTGKGNTVLHIAVIKNDETLVKTILENVPRSKLKSLLDAKTKATGTAALHVAAKQNFHANVSILLEYGANFKIRNKAGEKPVDLATSEKLRELFRLIDTSFRQAKRGDTKLTDNKEHTDALFSRPVVICRNDKGRTLMQVLLLGGKSKFKLADKLIHERMSRHMLERNRELESRRLESRRKSDVDELLERAREHQIFWKRLLDDSLGRRDDREAYRALEMAHEVLLAYRKMEGHDETLTTNEGMKVLEEVFEVLGFNPDERCVVMGDKDCYYNKLPAMWKMDVFSFQLLVNDVIYFTIGLLLIGINDLRIFRAVKDNDLSRVQQLLKDKSAYHEVSHEVIDHKGYTILSYAVESGNEDMVKLLLELGATMTHGCGVSFPLYLAVSQGHAKILQLLLSRADPKVLAEAIDNRPDKKRSVLHVASRMGRLDIVKMLLRHGARYRILDKKDRTPADVSTSQEVTRFLRLVDEYFQDAKSGNAEFIRKLEGMPSSDFLAIARTKNLWGQTLADVAASAGAKNLAETILRMICATHSEALIAAKKGDLAKLKQLLDQDLDIDAQDTNGRTLLHHAASHNQRGAVEFLLQKCADVLLTTDKGNTVLHTAVIKNDEALVKAILENVSRDKLRKLLDAKTKATGTAALHVAAKQDSIASVYILLEYGANFEIRNKAGEKPVDLAISEKLRELLRLIESSFDKAKRKDCKTIEDFHPTFHDLFPAVNCRNNEGRTLLQSLILHFSTSRMPKRVPSDEFICLRVSESLHRDIQALLEPSRRRNLDDMTKCAQDCRDLWLAQQEDIESKLISTESERRWTPADIFSRLTDKAVCLTLDKTRELLLTSRKTDRSLTANASMKSVEEVFEVMDFKLEEGQVVADQIGRYCKKLKVELNGNTFSLCLVLMLLYNLLYKSVSCYIYSLNSAQLFYAVKDDDMSKVQRIMDSKHPGYRYAFDENACTTLCYAVENGNTKMIKLLLKSGITTLACECLQMCGAQSPLYVAVNKGNVKIVKLVLKKAETTDLAKVIDYQREHENTALHVAAKSGRLDLVKLLLKYGASYEVVDVEGCTPLDVSTSEEVMELLGLVDNCFHDAKEGNTDLIYKLKAMSTDMFLAVAGTKDSNGQTLAVVAEKNNARSIAGMILRMIKEIQERKKLVVCAKL